MADEITPEQRQAMKDMREATLTAATIANNFIASGMEAEMAMLTIASLTVAYVSTSPDPKDALEKFKAALDMALDLHLKALDIMKRGKHI